jgi:hypothetical protein
MSGQPQDPCDWVIKDLDFRFCGAGIYGGPFYTQFYLDENCRFHHDTEAAFRTLDGDHVWFRHGLRHRDGDEPAFTGEEGKAWYKDGQLHREGGPAVEYANGKTEWWLQGMKLTDDEVREYRQKLVQEEWRKAADEIVAEMREGLKTNIRVMKPPRFLA